MTNGLILWRGASRINGEEIVAILTGLTNNSHNQKTGAMAQTWILKTGEHPHVAIKERRDQSICGECPLRQREDGVRLCYVNQMSLGQIYGNYSRGNYPLFDLDTHGSLLLFRYKVYGLRIGSYGDPASVPLSVWEEQVNIMESSLASKNKAWWTGYTRRWMFPENQGYRKYLMASCFSAQEQQDAIKLGWSTYRVKNEQQELIVNEISCPASIEQGKKTICSNCLLCNGSSGGIKSICIDVHGQQKQYWGAAINGISSSDRAVH